MKGFKDGYCNMKIRLERGRVDAGMQGDQLGGHCNQIRDHTWRKEKGRGNSGNRNRYQS